MEMALEWAVRMSRNSETAMLAQLAQGHRCGRSTLDQDVRENHARKTTPQDGEGW